MIANGIHPARKVGLVIGASAALWALVIYLVAGLLHTLGLA